MRLAAACVPGTLCDARVFAPLLTHLDLDAVHVPLTGTSVGDTAAALLAAAPARFVAIGFSLGGSAVLEALRRAPDRLLGVVLIASHGERDTATAAEERRRQREVFTRHGATGLIDDLWPRYGGTVDPDTAAATRATVAAMASAFDIDAFDAQAKIAATRADRLGDGPSKVPMLIIGGELDRLCPPARGAVSAGALHARHVVIGDAGHFVPLEQPQASAAAMQSWFADSLAAAA